MAKGHTKKYDRAAAAGQMPLLVPDSSWVIPSELPDLRNRPILACDTETKDDGLANGRGPGWVYKQGYICGVTIAASDISIYAPVRHPEGDCFDADAVQRWTSDHFRAGIPIVFQNGPYDLGWLGTEWGIKPPDIIEDTMAAANTLDENRYEYDLDSLCRWQGIPGKDEALLKEAARCYGVDPKSGMWNIPARYVAPYGIQDGSSTLALFFKFKKLLEEQDLWEAYRLDADLVPMVVEMRRRGIRIDSKQAEVVKRQFQEHRDKILSELSRKCGTKVTMKDIKSNFWLDIAFGEEGIAVPKLLSGKPSYDSEWMSKRDHWLPKLIADAREYNDAAEKFIGTYIQGFTHMGRIHAEIHHYRDDRGGTKTSRLSYSQPPLQQMPSRNPPIAVPIRGLFLPEPGEIWGAPDYSQQEYRLIVHFAYLCQIVGADMAVKIYRENPKADFHQIVVELTGLSRNNAKDANFAKVYRAGVPKFALMTDKSLEEAGVIYKQYDEKLPFVSRFAEYCDSKAQKNGYLKLIDGAKAHFNHYEPRWIDREKYAQGMRDKKPMGACSMEEALRRQKDEKHPWYREKLRRANTYKAGNKLIQGSAARQTKMAMRECWRAKIIPKIQMHDELCFSFGRKLDAERVVQMMTDVVPLCIPVMVDAEYGVNWGRAQSQKTKGPYQATWEEAWNEMKAAA